MDSPTTRLRRAETGDADRLTAVAFAAKRHWGYPETWIEAWRDDLTVTPEDCHRLDIWLVEDIVEKAAAPTLSISSSPTADFVVSGFIAVKPATADEPPEIEHLWVTPAAHGRGLGRRLFETAVSDLQGRAPEDHSRELHVLSDPNAAGFYHRMGCRPIGEHVGMVDGEERRLPLLSYSLTGS